MKELFSKYKAAIVLLILILLGFWAYSSFNPQVEILLQEPAAPVGEELFAMLNKLQGISLDDSVFKDPDFRILQDFETEVPAGLVGRENPFAPVGRDTNGKLVEPTHQVLPLSTTETFFDTGDISTTSPAGI